MIQWNSQSTEILLNPRLPKAVAYKLKKQLQYFNLPGHIWLTTSGTTGKYKCVALSKEAFFISANSVNKNFHITSKDIWVLALPEFHVGGIGVRARSQESGAKVIKMDSWCPHKFYCCTCDESATVSALVPTQMYDIVVNQYRAPSHYRFTFIGGAVMTNTLFEKSLALGWNPIPTYGMTETCSQIANTKIGTLNGYYPLDHISLRIEKDQKIAIKSDALFTAYAENAALIDPKIDGWYLSEDLGSLHNEELSILGRGVNIIKIHGETVNIAHLQAVIEDCGQSRHLLNAFAIVPVPDQRSGYQIHLVVEGSLQDIESLLEQYNQQVMPYEKIQKVHFVERFPRSNIGKVLVSKLYRIIPSEF